MSSASLRTGESWTPVCLVHFSDKGFVYAYISYLTQDTDVVLVFLSTVPDGEQFHIISRQAAIVKTTLEQSDCLASIAKFSEHCPIDLRTETESPDLMAAPVEVGGHLRGLLGSQPAATMVGANFRLLD